MNSEPQNDLIFVDENEKRKEVKTKNGKRKKRKVSGAVAKAPKSLNAFQVLMDSQKKVIGANPTGKEAENVLTEENRVLKEVKVKRKLYLEKWASEKGGDLKKQSEADYDNIINNKLKRRKVKFTKMLLNKKANSTETVIAVDDKTDDADEDLSNVKNNNSLTKVKSKEKIEDGEPNSKNKRLKKANTLKNNKSISVLNLSDDFLDKLSPSMKKEENMLSYFKKIQQTEDKGIPETIPLSDSSDSDVALTKIKVKITMKSNKSKVRDEICKNPKSDSLMPNSCSVDDGKTNKRKYRKKTKHQNKESSIKIDVNALDNSHIDETRENRRSSRLCNKSKSLINVVGSDLSEDSSNIISDDDFVPINKAKRMKTGSKQSCEVISDDNSRSKKIKLAPLFVKSLPKPLIDPGVLEARQKFLYSSIDDVCEKKINTVSLPPVIESNTFPVVVHVQQIPNEDDCNFSVWNLPTLVQSDQNFLSENASNNDIENVDIQYAFSSNKNKPKILMPKLNRDPFEIIQNYNLKEGVLKLKNMYSNFPVYKVFKQMKQKFVRFDKELEKCQENEKADSQHDNDNFLWTEKYKPLRTDEIIGNFRSIQILKKWLLSWKECDQEIFKSRNKCESDSSDDFYSSDSDSNNSSRLPNNTYVVVGPVGCGKTSSIYAIANELDMNVLEVNASSKRTGRDILMKLQEATQSHKVKIGKDLQMNKNISERKKKKEKCKATKNETNSKSKSKIKLSDVDSSSRKQDKNKMSLILVEDADIVFEDDDGFITALSQIVQYSKRPIIIVTTDINCQHLKKFININMVKFHSLSSNIMSPWLDLLMLLECGKINTQFTNALININRGDMRKTILQLQFWALGSRQNPCTGEIFDSLGKVDICDEDTASSVHVFNEDSNLSEQDLKIVVENFNSESCESSACKNINKNELDLLGDLLCLSNKQEFLLKNISMFDHNVFSRFEVGKEIVELDMVLKRMDSLSTIDLMQSKSDSHISRWCRINDSLLEAENKEIYYNNFFPAYCKSVIDCDTNLQNSCSEFSIENSTILESQKNRWEDKQHLTYSQLSNAVPISQQLDRRNLSLDYMACLRSICHSEKIRFDTNGKRNNRFYHYLTSINVDSRNSLFDEACDIFHTKIDKLNIL